MQKALGRRRVVGALLSAVAAASERLADVPAGAAVAGGAAANELLAQVVIARPPPAPCFVGLAHLVLPPGGETSATGEEGPRLIVVESGTLTLTDQSGNGTPSPLQRMAVPGAVDSGGDILLGPGDHLGLRWTRLGTLRNDGARASVFLDAAVLPVNGRPDDGAFTTRDGVSFQLLAGSEVHRLPDGPVEFRLSRRRMAADGTVQRWRQRGPAVGYVESGSMRLDAHAGAVAYSRAAAAAPASAPGPMRPIDVGSGMSLAAGASFFLPLGADIAVGNPRAVPVSVLLLEVLPRGAP